MQAMQRLNDRFRKCLLSSSEMTKRYRCIVNVKQSREGLVLDPLITVDERRSWVIRVMNAVKLPATTHEESKVKYAEIRSVCSQFIDRATLDAMVIIDEYYLPKHLKTIPVYSETNVDGRMGVCGRGIEGKTFTYEYHNIVYRVCLDDNGVFNGSDECAAKAAGRDRLGSLEFFKCHVKTVNVPLTVTVDYHGFRVLAVAKLPTEIFSFNDEGELRKVSENMLHGIVSRGDNFVNQGKLCNNAMKQIGEMLNLAPHDVMGFKDISISKAYVSSELKVYSGYADELYLKDFWRSFPSEAPEATPHLNNCSRGQSVYWRQLRPEFCKRYAETCALSPDAFCLITMDCKDRDEHLAKVEKATQDLLKVDVFALMEELSNRNYSLPLSQGLGLDLTLEMHCRGINVRHLGYMRYLCWRQIPGTLMVFHHEKCIRTSKDLRDEVMHGDSIQIHGVRYTITESKHHKITHKRLPTEEPMMILSAHGLVGYVGRLKSEKNSLVLRSVLFGEMIARTIKQLIRLQLRQYTQRNTNTSIPFMIELICRYFNVVTGSDENSDNFLQEVVYGAIRERFGNLFWLN